jgi:hypothetical protein
MILMVFIYVYFGLFVYTNLLDVIQLQKSMRERYQVWEHRDNLFYGL